MPPLSTAVALIPPITCFAISSPVAIIATVVAAPSSWRRASSKVFTGTSWTSRAPPSKLHYEAVPIKFFAIQIMSSIIRITRITEFLTMPPNTWLVQDIKHAFQTLSIKKIEYTRLRSHREFYPHPT
jgi:hypothetical protein